MNDTPERGPLIKYHDIKIHTGNKYEPVAYATYYADKQMNQVHIRPVMSYYEAIEIAEGLLFNAKASLKTFSDSFDRLSNIFIQRAFENNYTATIALMCREEIDDLTKQLKKEIGQGFPGHSLRDLVEGGEKRVEELEDTLARLKRRARVEW